MRVSPARALTYLLLVTSVSVLWLFSPAPKSAEDYCGRYVSIGTRMGFVVNCDADTYIDPAESPARLMQAGEVRQSRPLYILLGTLVGYPLRVILAPMVQGIDPRTPFHIGFALLNLILLYVTVLLFDALMTAAGVNMLIVLPLAVFLVANDVTKAFVWTAHQQMFSLFTPLAAIEVFRRVAGSGALPPSRLWIRALALGLLPLVYGNFLIILPTLLLADALACRRNGVPMTTTLIVRFGPTIAAFLLPTLAWAALVMMRTGSYYNHEVAVYRQLIWLVDAARTGAAGFAEQANLNTRAYAATFMSVEMLPLCAPFLVRVVANVVRRRGEPQASPVGLADARAVIRQGWGVVFVCFFLFLWALGYYQTRLTFTLVPPTLCLCALELSGLAGMNRHALRRLAWLLGALAVLWTVYHVMKYGPFS